MGGMGGMGGMVPLSCYGDRLALLNNIYCDAIRTRYGVSDAATLPTIQTSHTSVALHT